MTDEYVAANRANWDDRVAVHLASEFYDVKGWLAEKPGPRQREHDALGDVAGLLLVHLQCHFGLDTLAFANAGARVVGLDFSPAAIDAARLLAEQAALSDRAVFVVADVLDAANALAPRQFDVVYVSLGSLCWLSSIQLWAQQVAALIGPTGRLYLHDVHPLAMSLGASDALAIEHPYFEEVEPTLGEGDVTYTDGEGRLSHTTSYEWNHSIGEVVTALLGHGLRIDHLAEHDWTVFEQWPWLVRDCAPGRDRRFVLPSGRPRIPLTFTLLASRG